LLAHVLAPNFDLVAVTRDGLGTTIDAGFGADEIESELLRALAALYIGKVLVFMDAMCNSACP
jgi:hypothetical protein